jgi:hypothetical protein
MVVLPELGFPANAILMVGFPPQFSLALSNHLSKQMGEPFPPGKLQLDALSQIVADGVAAVLDGDDTGTPASGNDGDGFPGVAAQGEQEGIHLLVIGINSVDQIFKTHFGILQIHKQSPDFRFHIN